VQPGLWKKANAISPSAVSFGPGGTREGMAEHAR